MLFQEVQVTAANPVVCIQAKAITLYAKVAPKKPERQRLPKQRERSVATVLADGSHSSFKLGSYSLLVHCSPSRGAFTVLASHKDIDQCDKL